MCEQWTDHQWREPKFVESGRHPSMGRYLLYLVRCANCPRETTMTEWLDMPIRQEPQEVKA